MDKYIKNLTRVAGEIQIVNAQIKALEKKEKMISKSLLNKHKRLEKEYFDWNRKLYEHLISTHFKHSNCK